MSRSGIAALPGLLLAGALAAPAARADVVKGPSPCVPAARVASLAGSAASDGPDGHAELACGHDICAGDRVSTGAGGGLGLLSGGMLIQLGEESRAVVGLTPEGTPRVELEQGRVRIIDPRDGGPPGRLSVLGSQAELVGTDTDAELVGAGPERSGRFCEYDAPLRVDGQTLAPGSCAVVRPGSPPVAAAPPAGGTRLAALDADCKPTALPPVAGFGPLPPVAAAPVKALPLPGGLDGPLRSACDVPGSGCTGFTSVVEQPPTTGPFPGGGGGEAP
ncbi:MAG TPA: hypothetical protein VFC77_06660 [Myxococcota bacterium]|nr:hypothetical protein [Myxococcota bacterium]